MKKKRIWMLLIFIILMGVMGCREEKTEQKKKEEKKQIKKEDETQKLVLWSYYETDAQKEGLDKLVKGFNDSQNTYQIVWEFIPMGEFTKNLSFSKSTEDYPDLVLVDNPDMEGLIKIGLLADITDPLKGNIVPEEYYEEVWKSVEYQKRCYGVPFACNNTAIIYNKQMFREKNVKVPITWSEFKKVVAAVTKGGTRGHYGFAMSAVNGEQGAFQFMPWLLATGIDKNNLKDERTMDAFLLMEQLLEEKSMPNDCMNWSQNDLTRSFIRGKVAMIENGPWALAQIEKSGIDFGIFEIPVYASRGVVLGGENLAAINGKNLEGAIAFINYYNQKEIMEDICQIMRNIPPKVEMAKDYGERNPNYQVFVNQMDCGVSRNSIKNWKGYCHAISNSLNQIFGSDDAIQEIWQQYVNWETAPASMNDE